MDTFTANANANGELGSTIRTLTLNTQATLRPVDKDGESLPTSASARLKNHAN